MIDLLGRLDGVREIKTGSGRWIAKCPSHDDRSPSLSIRLIEGDRWLLHCFGGCDPIDVCDALGIELCDLLAVRNCVECSELFQPRHPDHQLCPGCYFKSDKRPKREPRRIPRIPASDALAALEHETSVAWFIATDIVEHREIDEETWARLTTAARRIGDARAQCCPAVRRHG